MINSEFIENMNSFPLIVIGGAVVDFKKYYKGPISRATTPEDLRDFVSYYQSVSDLGRVLVLEDISFLSNPSCEGLLLKFVEETRLSLVLLSTYDKVSSILLSRAKSVVKYYNTKTESDFGSVSSGFQRLNDTVKTDSHYYDRVRYMSKFSPKLYYLDKVITSNRVKTKILQFVD